MKKNRNKKNIIILTMIIICILLIAIGELIARYISKGLSEENIDIAYYIIDGGIQSQKLVLDNIVPRKQPYKYEIQVSNVLNGKKSETVIEYYLEIEATTNLPVSYEIYSVEDNRENQIKEYEVYKDEDGVYYKKMKTETKQLGLAEQRDIYILSIEFPEENKTNLEYADILEMLNITIESKQKI